MFDQGSSWPAILALHMEGDRMNGKAGSLILTVGLLTTMGFCTDARPPAAPMRLEITAQRFFFTPNEITVKKGQPVILIFKSLDVGHGLSVPGLHIDLKVKPLGTAELQFTPEKAGDFRGHCSMYCGPGHGKMLFTIHVAP